MKPNIQSSTLVQYSDQYEQALSNFELPDNQLEFTSYPLKKIQDPSISPDTVHVMIVAEDKPVGYFALEKGNKLHRYTNRTDARLLTSFSIDFQHQGKGFAKQALTSLPDFLREHLPDTKEIVLGVNKRNAAAISLYLKTGFVDEHEVYVGPKGPQHVLHLRV